jgi:hypothetical protein
MANIHDTTRRDWPAWHQRGKIRKVAPNGDVLEGYAFNGEFVAISPRYQRNGQNYRVRPERPAAFFAAFCFENSLLPELLTAAECEQERALALLDSLWDKAKHRFAALSSPYAASDGGTVPNHRLGFSFNILQVLVEHQGSVRPVGGKPTFRPALNGVSPGVDLEAARQTILAMRARANNGTAPATGLPVEPPADPALLQMQAQLVALRQQENPPAPTPVEAPPPDVPDDEEPLFNAIAPTTEGSARKKGERRNRS